MSLLRIATALAVVVVCGACAHVPVAADAASDPDATKIACTAGPVETWFGALPWLAYACDDGRSVALVSSPGNPAAPFSFVVRPSDHGVRVQGDGAGDRGATAPAFAELMALDADALLRLYARALLEAEPDGG